MPTQFYPLRNSLRPFYLKKHFISLINLLALSNSHCKFMRLLF